MDNCPYCENSELDDSCETCGEPLCGWPDCLEEHNQEFGCGEEED